MNEIDCYSGESAKIVAVVICDLQSEQQNMFSFGTNAFFY